jgi:hypothetical protein
MAYKMPTSLSANTPSLGKPKCKCVQVPTRRVWYYSNKILKMLELKNYEIFNFRVDVDVDHSPKFYDIKYHMCIKTHE